MQETSASLSSSLLPLPPPLTGTTPTKRRSKVPNNDRRNNDIEFATEIGQGLLVEVRKMQTMLQEKEEQLRALQIQKADLERAAEALTKQLRQKEEAEERLKEEAWNLELIKQELTISVTKLQQQLSKANVDQHKLDRQLMTVTGELEQVRSREDKLTVAMETLKTRHEQDMAGVRRHLASMQREKQELNKQMDVLSSELAIAKAQSRMARRSHQDLGADAYHPESFEGGLLAGATLAAGMDAHHSDDSPDSSPHDKPNALLSPSSSSTSSATNRQQQQAMEVESLRTSLGHAHRMISTLRSNLHKEKTEKFELKKLLADSQETIEQFQNDPRMWEDADPTNDQEPSSSADALATGTLAGATRRGGGRRARRRSRLRSLGQHASSSTNLAGSRPVSQVLEVDNEFEDDDNVSTDDDQDEYSSAETDFEEDLPVRNSWRDKQQKPKLPMPLPLSLELSQSQSRSGSTSPVRMTPSLSTDPTHPASPSSSTERSPRPHRSLGDELTLADPVSQLPADPETEPASHHALPDALMGAAVGAVGATLANTLANKAQPPSPGVNVSCQTDDVVPVETKHVEAQTDDVVVSLPVESKHVEAQTDDVVVSLPVESKHVEAQTDDVVVTLPVETKHVEAQTDDVVVSLPVESRHVEAQTDEVVVSLPVETKHVEAQTDDVVVSLPVESKHVEAQTDDVVVTLPVETKHVEAQTDDVVVSVPVVSIQGGVQTDKVFVVDPSSLCESAVQTAVVPLLDTAAQCEPISSHDDLLQTEALAVKDQSTQSTPAPVLHQAVQSDPLAGYDMSVQATIAAEAPLAPVQAAIDGQGAAPVDAALHLVQPEPEMAAVPNAKPTVESVKPTTSSNEPQAQRETEMATVASGKAAGPSEPTASASSQNNSSTLSSLLTTGAAALGLGALMGMKSKDAMDSHVGTSDKAPSTSANDLPSPDNPQVPLPSESAAQLDNREASGDMPVTKMMPSQALPSTPPASPMPTTEDVSEDTKRHTCDMSTAPHDMESFGLSPTSGRPSLESQPNSLNTSVDSFPSSKANDTSSSPSSPSTPVHSHDNSPMATATLGSAALARHSLMSVPQASPAPPNTRLDKGKEAMQASPPSHYGMAYAPQNHHNAMARVNPNYYNQAKHASTISQATANGHPDEFDSTLLHAPRSTSPAPSASSAMDPSIALITETMMGHWLWKSPRRSHTLRRQDPLHQRYFWIHPYTRTLYWSREAPGAPRRDSKTKSAYIETIQVVPNQLHAAGINVPDVSICVMTSDGEMKLTAPDMATHKTWVEVRKKNIPEIPI
ncbi:hypothetical protein DM01DRAFT_1227432 [Hesseltinella vesiculosa]|uniref:Pleckstrin homology domain-containing protein n=1 Tax=Hesseltinella vesiculosa TaxID=101127 RepID=A0A1X2GMV6_9FUNG|nr:hypothetical protein DM01DRAFT_1227432 [Hesseltinella vesiculosa]